MRDQKRQTSGWQLEQSAAEAYEQYFVPIIFGPWADRLVSSADLRPDDRVLDIGCGTGIVARRAAARVGDGGAVVGLDLNEGMLHVAEATATKNRLTIEWRQGDAADLPFSDRSFDCIFSQQSFQYFDDPAATLGEMRRVLGPDGRVVLSVWRPLEYNPGYVTLADALERHFGDEAGEMMRSPFPDWRMADLRDLFDATAFDDYTIVIEVGSVRYPSAQEFIRQELASSPLADQLADGSMRAPLVREVEEALGAYTDDDGVISPMESWVVTAQR